MRSEDKIVQQQLIGMGYSAQQVECRGSMFGVLEQLLADPSADQKSNIEDLVASLRDLLSLADRLDSRDRLALARQVHKTIKGCPEPSCGRMPDIDRHYDSDGQSLIVCMAHADGAVMREGSTLIEAIANWNSDDWVPGEALSRPDYSF
ncbi:Hypothetical protein I1A_000050 (plasmid) [Pseudomonas fluorescens R124]|uniref:Uncharacterized protein n=1 Tax=Pseudomonas fluorescens R124 TaxID=743713 RepID=K0WRY2_PSEFL|nr:hypothetical protein [Pseudomonas fluorescens]AFS51726.1 hypothetical protein I1A_000050 [Pseudomonas fluorescens R124]EJZ60971.1 Hypothetical protein I1A_000050 [Pseudomonas fluorescens R124]